jgi:hypothetical protein
VSVRRAQKLSGVAALERFGELVEELDEPSCGLVGEFHVPTRLRQIVELHSRYSASLAPAGRYAKIKSF